MATIYKDFQPTGMDPRGLGLDDRQEWLVCPVSRTRDSGALSESNFASALEILGGESDTVEVHRFGHWGPGWFEIVLVDPAREAEVDAIEAALADYPVLNDEDLSLRELHEAQQGWASWGYRDFTRALGARFKLDPSTVYWLNGLDSDWLWSLHMENADHPHEAHDEGPHFDFKYLDSVDRATLAGWLRKLRKSAREARDVNTATVETVQP